MPACGRWRLKFQFAGWNAVRVPARTPRVIVHKINGAITQVLKMPDVNKRMLASGFEPGQTTVEAFDAFVRKEARRYAGAIKESNFRVDR